MDHFNRHPDGENIDGPRNREAKGTTAGAMRRNVDRAVSTCSETWETFFEVSPHLFCTTDESLHFRQLNAAWERTLGWTQQELHGQPFSSLVHPDDLEATQREIRSVLEQTGRTVGFRNRYRHKEGRFVCLSWFARVVRSVFYAEAVDVSSEVRVERALQEGEARTRAVLNSAVDAILTIDESGVIQDANPATERLFGYRRDELTGRNVSMLMPAPHRDQHDQYVRHYIETGEARVIGVGRETSARHKDGRIFPVELSVGEARLEDRRLFTGILRDVSARVAAQRRLQETLLDLKKSREDLLVTLNQLRAGALLVEGTGRIAFASENWENLAWRGLDEAVGKYWEEALPIGGEDRATLRRVFNLPAAKRTRLSLGWSNQQGEICTAQADVKDDPRDSAARIVFVYDSTELQQLRSQVNAGRYGRMVGDSPAMRAVYAQIEKIAAGDWTTLVEGETGVGKELVARAIHAASRRSRGPFVAVNCAGLTDTLLESQLFGHRRGAFTGAVSDQQGLFEAAEGGSLMLDEIGDISVKLQSTLLRVLQEREILRVGDTRVRPVDVRVIAATSRDLQAEAASGRFRADLLYRIRVARIRIPPLRDRIEDVPLLATSFLEEQRLSAGKPALLFDKASLEALRAYPWPGNVRELRSAVEHAVIECAADVVTVRDLPPEVAATHGDMARTLPAASATRLGRPLSDPRPQAAPSPQEGDDRAAILEALQWAEGNRARAARRLGIGRTTLYRRLAQLKIPTKRH